LKIGVNKFWPKIWRFSLAHFYAKFFLGHFYHNIFLRQKTFSRQKTFLRQKAFTPISYNKSYIKNNSHLFMPKIFLRQKTFTPISYFTPKTFFTLAPYNYWSNNWLIYQL